MPVTTNQTKLAVAVVGIIACTVLLVTHSISEAAGMAPITLIVGYIIGNGVASAQGKPVTPIIGRADDRPMSAD